MYRQELVDFLQPTLHVAPVNTTKLFCNNQQSIEKQKIKDKKMKITLVEKKSGKHKKN